MPVGGSNALGLMAALLLVFLALFQAYAERVQGFTLSSQPLDVIVGWVRYSNPSVGDDGAQAVCQLGDTLFTLGFDSSPGNFQFRVEAREVSTGELVRVWTRNPGEGNDTLVDCIAVNGYVYASGATIATQPSLANIPKAYVLRVDQSLEDANIKMVDLGWLGVALTIESDGSYLYVGGGDLRGLNLVFRVDKLDKSLSRVSYYKSQGLGGHHLIVTSMTLNKVTNHLWLVGVAVNESGGRWWIEVIDPNSMSLVKSIDPKIPGVATAVLSDSEGYTYVLGDRGYIAKFDKDGNIVAKSEFKGASFMKGAVLGDLILVAGHESSGGYNRHTIYVLDKGLQLLLKKYLSLDVNTDSYMGPGRMWVNGSRVYLAGFDREPGNYRWVTYSLEVKGLQQTVTVTVTLTTTTTQTTTVTSTQTVTTIVVQPTTITQTTTVTTTSTTTLVTTVTQPAATTVISTTTTTITTAYTTTLTLERTRIEHSTYTTTLTVPSPTTVTETFTTRVTVVQTRTLYTTTRTVETVREYATITSEIVKPTTLTVSEVNWPISIATLLVGLTIGAVVARVLLR